MTVLYDICLAVGTLTLCSFIILVVCVVVALTVPEREPWVERHPHPRPIASERQCSGSRLQSVLVRVGNATGYDSWKPDTDT